MQYDIKFLEKQFPQHDIESVELYELSMNVNSINNVLVKLLKDMPTSKINELLDGVWGSYTNTH